MTTLKLALMTGALLAATSTAMAATADVDLIAPTSADTSCAPTQAVGPGCALRIVDAGNDAPLATPELANPAARLSAAPWWGLNGLAFKDAAVESGALLTGPFEHEKSKSPLLALMALGALVILLRRRPAGF